MASQGDEILYIGDENCQVTMLNTTSDQNIKVIKTVEGMNPGGGVRGLDVSQDGRWVYVAQYGNPYKFEFLDANAGTIAASIPITNGYYEDLVASPDGKTVYAGGSMVDVIDVASRSKTGSIDTMGSRVMALSPSRNRLYVGSTDGLTVVDAATGKPVTKISMGQIINDIVLSPDAKKIYVSYSIDNQTTYTGGIYVIDADTNQIAATLPVVGVPKGLGLSPDGRLLYVAANHKKYPTDDAVVAIDTTTGQAVKDFSLSGSAASKYYTGVSELAVRPDGAFIYVTQGNALLKIDKDLTTILKETTPATGSINALTFKKTYAAAGSAPSGTAAPTSASASGTPSGTVAPASSPGGATPAKQSPGPGLALAAMGILCAMALILRKK